jgi:uncharacterized protein (TIRG00374 family)
MEGVTDEVPALPRHKRRLRRDVKWGITAFIVVLVAEYLVVPELAGARRSLNALKHLNVGFVVVAVVLEAASLLSYALLTRAVLPPGVIKLGRLVRIDLSTFATSHVVPGGSAPGTALSYRLLTASGVESPDAAFALATQGVGSAVVLNAIFWVVLVVSLFFHPYNPLYLVGAGVGVLLIGAFAAVVLTLLQGRERAIEIVRKIADKIPFLDGNKTASVIRRIAERLSTLVADRDLLRRAVGWAAANWLLDAASLWVFVAAYGKLISPIDLLVAYGLANILAVIPITPGGLGVIEGVLIPTLSGFGVGKGVATVAVLSYRLVNFWLPIPVGGACYLSLRLESVHGFRQRVEEVRNVAAPPRGGGLAEGKDRADLTGADQTGKARPAGSDGGTGPNRAPGPDQKVTAPEDGVSRRRG